MRVLGAVAVLALVVGPTAPAHNGTNWYWSKQTAEQVLVRFVYGCYPRSPACSHEEVRTARALGLRSSPSGLHNEDVTAARCRGTGEHIHNPRYPDVPLYREFVCRLRVDHDYPPKSRRLWCLLHVLGSANLDKPDASHHFRVERLP